MALDLGGMKHFLTLETPSATTPDGDGGFTQTWAALSPGTAWASIERASQAALERLVSNTIVSQASHIVTMRYHPDITTQSRIRWTDRAGTVHIANVTDVTDVDGLGIEMALLVMEIVP